MTERQKDKLKSMAFILLALVMAMVIIPAILEAVLPEDKLDRLDTIVCIGGLGLFCWIGNIAEDLKYMKEDIREIQRKLDL